MSNKVYIVSEDVYPVESVAGKTGKVTLQASDITDFAEAVEELAITPAPTEPITPASIGAVSQSVVGAINGIATLDAEGKLSPTQIPDIAVAEFLGEAVDETAMLALRTSDGSIPQPADWCARTDVGVTFIVTGNPGQASGWRQQSYPAAPVQTVAGRTGNVTLSTSDITGLGTAATHSVTDFASPEQGAKADSALQPGALPVGTTIPSSQVTGFSTLASSSAPVQSVAGKTGAVVAGDIVTGASILAGINSTDSATKSAIQASVSGGIDPISALRQSIGAAVARDPQRAAWLPAPVWTAGESVKYGYIRSNGGMLYQCYSNSGTCGAMAPTHITGVPTSDGGVIWVWCGMDYTAAAAVGSPTASWVDVTGRTRWHPVTNAGAFFYSGGIPVALTALSNNAVQMGSALMTPGTGTAANGLYNQFGAYVQFWADDPDLCISGYNSAYPDVCIFVECGESDGQMRPLYPGPTAPSATTSSGGLRVQWGGAPRPRKYRVWLQSNGYFGGVYTSSARYRVWAASPANGIKFTADGDSLTTGANNFPLFGYDLALTQLARLCGVEDACANAVGGTGLISTSGGTQSTYAGRRSHTIALAGNVHHVFGCANDTSQTPAAITAALTEHLNALRAALPGQLVIVWGCDPVNSGPSAAFIATENALKAAVDAQANRLCKFIPISTATYPPFFGTGNVNSMQSLGNASIYTSNDNLHPTLAGITHMARWRFQALVNAIAAW